MNLLSSFGGNITDVVIILILVIFCIGGFKKGFANSFFSTFGTFFAVAIAFLLCSSVATSLESKFGVITSISNWVSGLLTKIFGEEVMLSTLRDVTESSLSETNLTAWLIKIIIDVKSGGDVPLDVTVSNVVSPVFGYYITCIISVVALFIVIKIVFYLIGEFVKSLHEIAVIGFFDKALGLIFGAAKGLVAVQLIIVIIKVIPLELFQTVTLYIEDSLLAGLVNQINLFSYLLDFFTQVDLAQTIKSFIGK